MPKEKIEELYIVEISSKEEQDKLYNFCQKNGIKITYPDLFKGEQHSLFGINRSGVGLVSTIIARHTPKKNVARSVSELEKIFNIS